MTVVVRVHVSGLTEAQQMLQELGDKLDEREKPVIAAVNSVAEVWRQNFDSEGSAVGGWPALAEYTVSRREDLGFGAEHPILLRYGALRAVAVEFFQKAQRSGATAQGDDYSPHVTTAELKVSPKGEAALAAHGWKVSNQYAVSGKFGHPARPYWFVDNNAIAAGRQAVSDWVEDILRGL